LEKGEKRKKFVVVSSLKGCRRKERILQVLDYET